MLVYYKLILSKNYSPETILFKVLFLMQKVCVMILKYLYCVYYTNNVVYINYMCINYFSFCHSMLHLYAGTQMRMYSSILIVGTNTDIIFYEFAYSQDYECFVDLQMFYKYSCSLCLYRYVYKFVYRFMCVIEYFYYSRLWVCI